MRLLLILLACLCSSFAFAQTVVKVEKIVAKKKLVLVNGGKTEGFKPKKKVCFYDTQNNKVGCGVVRTVKGSKSSIFVKKEEILSLIEVGMIAAIDKNKDVKITIDENQNPVDENKPAPNYVGIFGAFPLVDSVGYKNLIYETPLGEDAETMWTADSSVASVSFGAEVGFGIKSFTLALGGRSRTYTPKKVASDYADKNNDQYFEDYAETIGKGSSIGFWLDFYWLKLDYGLASVMIGNGVDLDTSTVDFTMDQLSEDSDVVNKYVTAKSTLKTTSIRTNILLDFNFGSVGFKMGAILYAPIQQEQKFTFSNTDPETISHLKVLTAEEDLKSKLGHKAKFGAELLIMGYFAY